MKSNIKNGLKFKKEIISKIAKLNDWTDFEKFIAQLYENSPAEPIVKRNYKKKGRSKRLREIDVLVNFKNATLGVECKYWNKKVDGDVVDVAAAKKEDLNIDHFAIITTIGYEKGAMEYAKHKNIDIFVVRPTEDEDFIDTGKIIKVLISIKGSEPQKIMIQFQVVGVITEPEPIIKFLDEHVSRMQIDPDVKQDIVLDLYDFSKNEHPVSGKQNYIQGKRRGNLQDIVYVAWEQEYHKWYKGGVPNLNVRIDTKGFGIPLPQFESIALIEKISFEIEYSQTRTKLEFDRTQHFPLVLENIIKRSTQLIRNEKNTDIGFSLLDTIEEIPPDSLGRDGIHISMYVRKPVSADEPIDQGTETYVMTLLSPRTLGWKLHKSNP